MSIILHPDINSLDPDSICYRVYRQLYDQFFNAQEKKSETFPYGIEEGDELSIRLHNTAYGFAYAIAGASVGGEWGSAILLDYIKRSGGSMTGWLFANHGFQAGFGGDRIFETFRRGDDSGVRIHGQLELDSKGLYIGGGQILSFNSLTNTTSLNSSIISFGQAAVQSNGSILVGNRFNGVYIDSTSVFVNDYKVYHAGSANRMDVDWQMKNATVAGKLSVEGGVEVSGVLRAVNGAQLGTDGVVRLFFDQNNIQVNGYISFGTGCGIKFKDIPVIVENNDGLVIGTMGGDLFLGSSKTPKIRLTQNLSSSDGTSTIITPYGGGYFKDSLTVHHNSGEVLLSSYRSATANEGIIIHKRLRFGNNVGTFITGDKKGITLTSYVEKTDPDTGISGQFEYTAGIIHAPSTSLLKATDRDSASLVFSTSAESFRFDNPLEAKKHIGIAGSVTRLTDGALFFSDNSILVAVPDGIRHTGNAYFQEGLSSMTFSSGFAGSGWAIRRDATSGNISATFDQLTIRKQMRVYEMEVQKVSAVGGSLWISDTCSGDTVTRV